MRLRLFVKAFAMCVCAVSCCAACGLFGGGEQTDPAPEQQPGPVPVGPKHETGNCRNEHLEGSCTFLVASRAPGQSEDDPSGKTLYRVHHQLAVKGEDRTIELISADLLVPNDKVEELREHYRKNSPTPCKAYIVRPPCNPDATSVSLGVGPPEFATPGRF